MRKGLILSAVLLATAALAACETTTSSQPQPQLVDLIRSGDRQAAIALVTPDAAKAVESDGSTALIWAAHEGDAALVRALLAAGADAKAASDFGATPIKEALANGDGATIRALLEAGADPENVSPEGVSSLMVMARVGNAEAVRALLDHGADPNRKESSDDQTALMWAADQGHAEVIKLLVAAGADVNAKSKFRFQALRVSAEPRVSYNPSGGLTPLLYASRQGCLECVKALVEGGADVNMYDPDGVSPLILATLNANWDASRFLIENGADVDHFDWWGRNAVYNTVDYNTIPKGGRVDRPSLDDTTSLELLRILLDAGANPNLQLKSLPPHRNVGADRGADLLLSVGATPLLRAAKVGDAAAVELLLNAGANPDLATGRSWRDEVSGITPLMAAAGLGYQLNDSRGKDKTEAQTIEVIRMLIAAGADINAQDGRGRTALHGAVYCGYNEILSWLLQNGANAQIADLDGRTPIDVAQRGQENFRGQTTNVSPEAATILADLTSDRPIQGASR